MQLHHLLKKVFVLALLAGTSAYADGACEGNDLSYSSSGRRSNSGRRYSNIEQTSSIPETRSKPREPRSTPKKRSIPKDTPGCPDNSCCPAEPKPGPFAFTYPKDLCLVCPGDFYFKVDFLFMQPKEEGLEYAFRNTTPGPGSTELKGGQILGLSTESDSWDWDFGFRLGIGGYLNKDAWIVDFQYTWFKINEEVNHKAPFGTALVPLMLQPNAVDAGNPFTRDRASFRWHMAMNIFDLTLAKPFYVSRYFTMSPFVGLRGGWINQNMTDRYSGDFNGLLTGVKVRNKNDYWGIGTRFGVNTEWMLSYGWKLLANWSTSMLYGKFDVTQEAFSDDDSYKLHHEFYIDKPNMEYQLGLGWGTHYRCQYYHFGFQVLWEFQQWWDQNNLRKVFGEFQYWANDTVSRGDLTLSGVSLRFMFDF